MKTFLRWIIGKGLPRRTWHLTPEIFNEAVRNHPLPAGPDGLVALYFIVEEQGENIAMMRAGWKVNPRCCPDVFIPLWRGQMWSSSLGRWTKDRDEAMRDAVLRLEKNGPDGANQGVRVYWEERRKLAFPSGEKVPKGTEDLVAAMTAAFGVYRLGHQLPAAPQVDAHHPVRRPGRL